MIASRLFCSSLADLLQLILGKKSRYCKSSTTSSLSSPTTWPCYGQQLPTLAKLCHTSHKEYYRSHKPSLILSQDPASTKCVINQVNRHTFLCQKHAEYPRRARFVVRPPQHSSRLKSSRIVSIPMVEYRFADHLNSYPRLYRPSHNKQAKNSTSNQEGGQQTKARHQFMHI